MNCQEMPWSVDIISIFFLNLNDINYNNQSLTIRCYLESGMAV